MARQESDREDLLRDATAFVERIELAPTDSASGEHVFIGFRPDGGASVYFGAGPAYHFNSRGMLRRAYQDELLFKAEQGRLFALERVRQPDVVELRRRQLTDDEQATFLDDLNRRLRSLYDRCIKHEFSVVGQVPAETDVLVRAIEWLGERGVVEVAKSPYAR